MDRLLHAALFTPADGEGRWGLPLLLWGEPGTAKTAAIRALALRAGFAGRCEVLTPGSRGEGAFGVTPYPVNGPAGVRLAYPPPDWTDAFRGPDGEDLGGIVVVDEATTAPPALQPALLGLIQFRQIGSHQLPRRVRVLGAANRVEDGAGAWELAPAVNNRLGHLPWEAPPLEAWAAWLLGAGTTTATAVPGDAAAEEARVLAAWPNAWARAAGAVAAFLRARPALLHQKPALAAAPDAGPVPPGSAWPSRRTWDLATRGLAGAEIHGLGEGETDTLIAAFVGEGPAGELAAYRLAIDLPDPAGVLDGKVPWEHNPARLDCTAAVLGACSALVAPPAAEHRLPRARRLWGLIGAVIEDGADLAVPAATVLRRAGLDSAMIKEAQAPLAKLFPVLRAGGMA